MLAQQSKTELICGWKRTYPASSFHRC